MSVHQNPSSTEGRWRNVPVHGYATSQKRAGQVTGACRFTSCSVYEDTLHCQKNRKFIEAEITTLAKDGITVVTFLQSTQNLPGSE